jgi:hypothetical protein
VERQRASVARGAAGRPPSGLRETRGVEQPERDRADNISGRCLPPQPEWRLEPERLLADLPDGRSDDRHDSPRAGQHKKRNQDGSTNCSASLAGYRLTLAPKRLDIAEQRSASGGPAARFVARPAKETGEVGLLRTASIGLGSR